MIILLCVWHQLNSKGQPQERAIVVTDSHVFKLDASKGYQKNRAPLALSQVGELSMGWRNVWNVYVVLMHCVDLTNGFHVHS